MKAKDKTWEIHFDFYKRAFDSTTFIVKMCQVQLCNKEKYYMKFVASMNDPMKMNKPNKYFDQDKIDIESFSGYFFL